MKPTMRFIYRFKWIKKILIENNFQLIKQIDYNFIFKNIKSRWVLAVVNHEDYFAKIGDDHKFPINKFSELANYLIKKNVVKKFHKPYPCSTETLKFCSFWKIYKRY